MEDAASHSSLDSDEYVLVNGEPRLKICNNGNAADLELTMQEVLLSSSNMSTEEVNAEPEVANKPPESNSADGINKPKEVCTGSPAKVLQQLPMSIIETSRTIGGSTFYGCESEKNLSLPKPGDSPESQMQVLSTDGSTLENTTGSTPAAPESPTSPGSCSTFTHVIYLGCATVNAPKSEREVMRNIDILNKESKLAMDITLQIPNTSEGTVRLFEPPSNHEIASFKIHRILFCARGRTDSPEARCFAFTCSHGDSIDTAIFQCHVFSCTDMEMVQKIMMSFALAFRRVTNIPRNIDTPSVEDSVFKFEVTLEIKEEDAKGAFNSCPKDKNFFKIRRNLEKKLILVVQQVSANRELNIERCFGLLVSPGRNVKHSDMHLLDMVSMGKSGDNSKQYIISGVWDPKDPEFEVLNTETPKDTRVFVSIAVDLVISGIPEPVRFVIETKVKIYPQNERFWYFTRKTLYEQFYVKLKEPEDSALSTVQVESIKSGTEMEREKAIIHAHMTPPAPPPTSASSSSLSTPGEVEDDSDSDEPLMSGSGEVNKDCTEGELEDWADVLKKWRQNLGQRPNKLASIVKRGIPDALRGEVWQLLVGCTQEQEQDMYEAYRTVITKESDCEQVIAWDIHRTFPAHEFFRDAGGAGQDSLYKLSKAYSVYDDEIGYCQGLSFLAAALLLHMPEEQAFYVMVKIMFEYGHRNLFRNNFEELHMKFYQLERLVADQMPELYRHFVEMSVEAHMFASQWFLTLFTAKFPLSLVFRILDVYLTEGPDTIFLVAVALLKLSRKDLLSLDFEGILKYFRVSLPKRYRSEENAHELLLTAMGLKKLNKKLKKYEKEYITMKQQQEQQEDPVMRLQRENKRLQEANMRLEQENDDLAHELVTSKIALRNDLDTSEDKVECLSNELFATRKRLADIEEEKKRLEQESLQLKDMCRRELQRTESENTRNTAIIADYKQICTQLSERLEKQQTAARQEINQVKAQIQSCERCSRLLSPDGSVTKPFTPESINTMDPKLKKAEQQIRELELELAQTKLALVESECKNQDLTHDLSSAVTEIQTAKNSWFQKTLNSIKDVTVPKTQREDSFSRKSSTG